MNVLKNAIEEIWGLFVDDPIYAAAIVVWVVVVKVLLSSMDHTLGGLVLFLGLAVVLVALTYRQALGISKKIDH